MRRDSYIDVKKPRDSSVAPTIRRSTEQNTAYIITKVRHAAFLALIGAECIEVRELEGLPPSVKPSTEIPTKA